MPKFVTLLACRQPDAVFEPAATSALPLRTFQADRDGPLVTRLAEEIGAFAAVGISSLLAGPRPRGRGLIAELASRPGREVEAWLAVTPSRHVAGGGVAGLASLVACRSRAGIRHSIGWLMVHPAARRRGVGRALVARACRRAAELAADAVWVESRSDWAESMAFWRAVGFEQQG